MARLTTLVVSVMLAVGVKVPVQVMPPSLLLKVLRLPFSTVTSALAKLLTASLKVMVTKLVSPMIRALSARVMIAVGSSVSSVTGTDTAAPAFPLVSVAVTVKAFKPSLR